MEFEFDSVFTALEGADTVRIEFRRGGRRSKAKSAAALLAAGEVIATLTVQFRRDASGRIGSPAEVTLSTATALNASTLSRFAWHRWLSAADAYIRSDGPGRDVTGLSHAIRAERAKPKRPPQVSRRPGRAGHPAEHYTTVLSEYRELQSQRQPGETPLQRLAARRGVSENTVKGWLRVARQREAVGG